MKLHLGCGQVYLDEYVNIDYPLSEHTVQEKSVADEFKDLQSLKYKAGSIEEVRNHHVFEHFPRHIALALFASWHIWLKRGGVVHIEVPDFDKSSEIVFNPKSSKHDKGIALRHIFGSNEAQWAVHYDGWTKNRLEEMAKLFAYKNIKIKQTSYLATRNITLIAKKGIKTHNRQKIMGIARSYLSDYILDESPSEVKLLDIWLKEFDKQFRKSTYNEK